MAAGSRIWWGDAPKLNQYSQPRLAETVLATGQTRVIASSIGTYCAAPG